MKIILLVLCAILTGCASKQPTSLIGNNMDGWKTINGGEWEIENGVMYGTKKASNPKHCILVSEKEYSNFTLSMDYLSIKGNSGFYFRLKPADNKVGFIGYHAEIDSKGTNAGGIFDVAVKWIVQPEKSLIEKAFKPGQWNNMTIEAVDNKIKITLNGQIMSEIQGERTFKGFFGVQLHANENTQIKFKNLEINEL